MKRNKTFLLGLVLLFVAVLSLSLVSGTFARYVSTDQGFDSARVAKWGVTVVAFDEQFATSYDETVESSNTQKLVAPGTDKEVSSIVISGTPEVAVQITATANLELEGWTDANGALYCPVEFYVNSTKVDLTGCDTAEAIESAVEAAIVNALKVDSAAPNTDLAKTVKVKWAWPIDGNDTNDTYLGDQAAADQAATISLSVSCTVSQID